MDFISLTLDNLAAEHLCCAIADKKHQTGVEAKKRWLQEEIQHGHVFRKLDAKGKVFIEYAPIERALAPVLGDNYLYIYCLWVSGSFKGKGHGRALMDGCIEDARAQGKAGVCAIAGQKKKPFLSDGGFLGKFGFERVDAVDDYELLALSFDGSKPSFSGSARARHIDSKELTIYYSIQCPYILDCIAQCKAYCEARGVPLRLVPVENRAQAIDLPCVFNNWATFLNGELVGTQPLNEGYLKKRIG